MSQQRPLVVQQSFPDPKPTTNPYIVMLLESLESTDGLIVRTFRWPRALLGRYDVFHAHWPEILVGGASPSKALVRQALFALLMLRFAVMRTPIVRTQHNLELPSGLSRTQRLLLGWFDRATALRIALNEQTSIGAATSTVVIPHGHYRDWFATFPRAERISGRFGYFGLIRRYKNVESLVAVFRGLAGPYRLHVAGKPSTAELAESLSALAAADDRVTTRFEFLSDADLVQAATASELVVLPYTHMHNSGGVLAALSLDTPVLVPATPTNAALSAEVGQGWVFQYEGELDTAALSSALEGVRAVTRDSHPRLDRRDWHAAGRDHLAAYRAALLARRRRR